MKHVYYLFISLLPLGFFAQSVGINASGTAPNASAMLDVNANNKGVLIPNVALTSTSSASPITTPATSLLVYNTATVNDVTPGYYFWNGTAWQRFDTGNNTGDWKLAGNAGTNPTTNYVGTSDNNALVLRANNIERFRLNTNGEVIAGNTASPYAGDLLVGYSTAANPFGVNGYSAQNGSGTWGEVLTGSTTNFSAVQGVYGGSAGGAGALGNYNGTGTANTRAGVYGVCSTPAATNGGAGVYGYNNIASGNQHMGVLGAYNGSAFGVGVNGIGFGGGIIAGSFDVAVVGWRANNANYSGYFNGNHVIANGTKTASVGTQWGNQLLYCTESPEVWFEDVGRGKLQNGTATIYLDSIFKQVTVVDDEHPMHVFIQLEGECEDVFVTPGTTSFTVKEKNKGNSSTSFSYRVMAKRVNFQDHRYGNDPLWGGGDTRKYMQYAYPPPVDYDQNVKFQLEQKKNYKKTPMPEGFKYFSDIVEEEKRSLTREK